MMLSEGINFLKFSYLHYPCTISYHIYIVHMYLYVCSIYNVCPPFLLYPLFFSMVFTLPCPYCLLPVSFSMLLKKLNIYTRKGFGSFFPMSRMRLLFVCSQLSNHSIFSFTSVVFVYILCMCPIIFHI